MSLHFQSSNGRKITGKGFYIALGVCLIAIGVAAWTTYDSVVKYANPSESSSTAASQTVKPTDKTVSGVTGKPSSSSTASKASSSSTASKPVSSVPAKTAGIITNGKVTYYYPVGQAVSKKYSGSNLVKSVTMNDFRVHSGTDFTAKIGDVVCAIADGKVTDIYKDDLLGNVMVISHNGSVIARYCGLGDTPLVKKGANVKSGQKIGSVSTVPFEMVEPPHLHLEIKKDGVLVDPVSILSKK